MYHFPLVERIVSWVQRLKSAHCSTALGVKHNWAENSSKLFWLPVRLSVRPSACKLFTFHLLLQNQTWLKTSKLLQMKATLALFHGEIIKKFFKNIDEINLKSSSQNYYYATFNLTWYKACLGELSSKGFFLFVWFFSLLRIRIV